jgi:4-oxalocrotonate tautomerase
MPFIQVNMTRGRTTAQKREFTEVVTREAARILNCPPEVVWVAFNDVGKDDWATGGVLVSEQK